MEFPFYKMQGAGNDFVVINNIELALPSSKLSEIAQEVCQRKFSLGGDALMAVEQATEGGTFRMRFFNADGSEAEMCGNGARCIARYAYEQGLAEAQMVIETIAGPVPAERLAEDTYKVQLNQPTKFMEDLAFAHESIGRVDYVELGDPAIPHLVVACPNLAEVDLEKLKPLAVKLRYWDVLPKGANVNFYEIQTDGTVLVRTYERGVEDFTLACGTGSGSVAYALTKRGLITQQPVTLNVLGGQLEVQVAATELNLSGPATIVAKGILLSDL